MSATRTPASTLTLGVTALAVASLLAGFTGPTVAAHSTANTASLGSVPSASRVIAAPTLLEASPKASTAYAKAVLAEVNKARKAAGLKPLKLSRKLSTAAKRHSVDQATQQKGTHVGSNGSRAGKRIDRAGYRWCSWGENVAWGFESPKKVVAAWLASPSHRANILSKKFVHMGLATARGSNDVLYWTQTFGRGC